MDRYKLSQDVRVQICTPMLGRVAATFSKGTVTPKNDGEELALKSLVSKGLAEVVAEKGRKADEPEGDDLQ